MALCSCEIHERLPPVRKCKKWGLTYLQNKMGVPDWWRMSTVNCQLYGDDDFPNAWGIDETGGLWVNSDFVTRAAERYDYMVGDLKVTTVTFPEGQFALTSDIFTEPSVEEIKAKLLATGI